MCAKFRYTEHFFCSRCNRWIPQAEGFNNDLKCPQCKRQLRVGPKDREQRERYRLYSKTWVPFDFGKTMPILEVRVNKKERLG